MASTANRLIEVIALSQVYWVAFRILDDTVHLQYCYHATPHLLLSYENFEKGVPGTLVE